MNLYESVCGICMYDWAVGENIKYYTNGNDNTINYNGVIPVSLR